MALHEIYERVEEQTEPKINLVVRAYDRVIELLEEGSAFLKEGKGCSSCISRAIRIVTELLSALDFERGGEIAYGLKEIYMFSLSRMIEAEEKKEAGLIDPVIGIFRELREAWDHVRKVQLRGGYQG